MKKSTLISLAALAVAVVGVLIALAAYFKKKQDTLIDDFDDDLFYDDLEEDTEYYEAHLDDDCEECCGCCCEECCGCDELEEEPEE